MGAGGGGGVGGGTTTETGGTVGITLKEAEELITLNNRSAFTCLSEQMLVEY